MSLVFRSASEIPAGFGPSVAAIGNFDGVHCGHRKLLGAVVEEARARGLRSVAVTFDPHPERVLRPGSAPGLLTLLEHRLQLIASTGIEAILLLPFDAAFAAMSAHEFITGILAGKLGLRSLHEGGNFRCGRQAEAGAEELRQYGAELGFTLHIHSSVYTHGLEVSSSNVRALVAAGDLRRARWMLSRPFSVLSAQARGRGIGGRLLAPTVNLASYEGLLPANGVYVTRLRTQGRLFQAVANVGDRPTFGEPSFAVEAHILDYEPMEFGEEPLELEFLYRLRGERKWPSVEALREQIQRDAARARHYFGLLRACCTAEALS